MILLAFLNVLDVERGYVGLGLSNSTSQVEVVLVDD